MLKIQVPGSSPAVWVKNSAVLLPSQSALLTKEQDRTLYPGSCLCFLQEGRWSSESHKLILICLCTQNKVPSATTVLF